MVLPMLMACHILASDTMANVTARCTASQDFLVLTSSPSTSTSPAVTAAAFTTGLTARMNADMSLLCCQIDCWLVQIPCQDESLGSYFPSCCWHLITCPCSCHAIESLPQSCHSTIAVTCSRVIAIASLFLRCWSLIAIYIPLLPFLQSVCQCCCTIAFMSLLLLHPCHS